jgi:hypothetical protein
MKHLGIIMLSANVLNCKWFLILDLMGGATASPFRVKNSAADRSHRDQKRPGASLIGLWTSRMSFG